MYKICAVLAALLIFLPPASAAPKARSKLKCYSPKEMRDKIAKQNLSNPLMLLRAAARRHRAQPLRSALCRRGNVLMYRFVLLRRDGKVVVTYVSARTGKLVSGRK